MANLALNFYLIYVMGGILRGYNDEFDINLKNRHIAIQRRYDFLSTLNDLLIAVWFLIGSFFFLNDALVQSGTWLFIVGSAQLLIKPAIKMTSLIHVERVRKRYNPTTKDSNSALQTSS